MYIFKYNLVHIKSNFIHYRFNFVHNESHFVHIKSNFVHIMRLSIFCIHFEEQFGQLKNHHSSPYCCKWMFELRVIQHFLYEHYKTTTSSIVTGLLNYMKIAENGRLSLSSKIHSTCISRTPDDFTIWRNIVISRIYIT